MAITEIGRAALVSREAIRTKAYKDSVGVWTIGVGHTSMAGPPAVTPGLTITRDEALEIFSRDLVQYEAAIDRAVKKPMADHERDAFVSICYNIGGGAFAKSTFVKRFNAGDKAGCAQTIMSWRKPPEIISRREAERDQFLTPYSVRLPKARSNDARPITAPNTVRPPPRPPTEASRVKKWAEDELQGYEVEAIQKRLRELGYYTVGKVDGIWGPSTVGAIIALQTQAGIEPDGHYGPQTKAALADDKNKRQVSDARANTTASDLRQQGSTIAIQGRNITWASAASVAVAAFDVLRIMLANWDANASLPWPASMLTGFLPPGALVFIPILLNLYNALAAKGIVGARVEAERTGLHNGEPDPAPSPPVKYGPDGPGVGGFLGSLFGQR